MREGKMIRDEDIQAISTAVQSVEKRTSGEIVPMVLAESDSYSSAHWRLGIFIALLGALLSYYLFPEWEPVWYLWLELPLLALGYALAAYSPLKRMLIGPRVMAEEVHQRAIQQFHVLGFSKTQNRTGVLIAVSLLEHRVEVITDVGIDSKVPPGTWDELVKQLLIRIRAGNLSAGLIEAIEHTGEILQTHFPADRENEDELPNRLIIDL